MGRPPGSLVFGIAVGLVVAVLAYRWITAPEMRKQRVLEEAVVAEARLLLADTLEVTDPEIVDPLAPKRSVGKSYVYPAAQGWEVSGYYRRNAGDEWHAYLMALDKELALLKLKVKDDDPAIAQLAARDAALEVLR
jgi:hypothetical protein